MLIVDTCCQAIAFEELEALIQRDTHQCILRTEVTLGGFRRVGSTVVNLMASEISVETQCTIAPSIVILHSSRNHTSCYPLVGIVEWGSRTAWLAGIEMGDVGIHIGIPMVVEVIAQFQVTPILLKTHAGTVVVGASILGGNCA